jgi:beta-lactamase class A
VSDNTATNMLIDRVGGVDVINQTVDALSKAISAAYREGMVNGIPTWQGWIGIPLPRTSR